MASRTLHQRAARDVQKVLECSYNAALLVARSPEASAIASQDLSEQPFRKKLAYAVLEIMRKRHGV